VRNSVDVGKKPDGHQHPGFPKFIINIHPQTSHEQHNNNHNTVGGKNSSIQPLYRRRYSVAKCLKKDNQSTATHATYFDKLTPVELFFSF